MKKLADLTTEERKERPMFHGLLNYFPNALAEISHVSFVATKQHHPGEIMNWDRNKSIDNPDCAVRHMCNMEAVDTEGLTHAAKVAWRTLATLEEMITGRPLKEQIYKTHKVTLDCKPTEPLFPISEIDDHEKT